MTDDNNNNSTYRVATDELRSYVEKFERVDAEKKDLSDIQKEIMSEAKSRGYDTTVLRMIIRLRKKDPNDIQEQESVLELYKQALGMS